MFRVSRPRSTLSVGGIEGIVKNIETGSNPFVLAGLFSCRDGMGSGLTAKRAPKRSA